MLHCVVHAMYRQPLHENNFPSMSQSITLDKVKSHYVCGVREPNFIYYSISIHAHQAAGDALTRPCISLSVRSLGNA